MRHAGGYLEGAVGAAGDVGQVAELVDGLPGDSGSRVRVSLRVNIEVRLGLESG